MEIRIDPRLRVMQNADMRGKNILIRVDHNVVKNGEIKDPYRIDATLGTLYSVAQKGGRPILMTHVGRPFDKKTGTIRCREQESVEPIVEYLERKLPVRIHIPSLQAEGDSGIVLRPGALGDTLMLAPAAKRLPAAYRVITVGREPGISFLSRAVSRVFDMDRGGWHRLFSPGLQKESLPVGDAVSVIGFFSDRDGTVGENLRGFFPQASVFLFPSFPGPERSIHAAAHVAECFEAAGLPVNSAGAVSSACREGVLARGGNGERMPWVVFHPGSGGRGKNHPIRFWTELAVRICSSPETVVERCIWLMGPAEVEGRIGLEAACRASGGEIIRCPGAGELLNLFDRCGLYLGQDSGITHAAAMSGAPCVALFRNSDAVRWRPLGPAVEVIEGAEENSLMEEALSAVRRRRRFLLSAVSESSIIHGGVVKPDG